MDVAGRLARTLLFSTGGKAATTTTSGRQLPPQFRHLLPLTSAVTTQIQIHPLPRSSSSPLLNFTPRRSYLIHQYFPTPVSVKTIWGSSSTGIGNEDLKRENDLQELRWQTRIPASELASWKGQYADDDVPDPPPEPQIYHEGDQDNCVMRVYMGKGFSPRNINVDLNHGVLEVSGESHEQMGNSTVDQEVHLEFPLPESVLNSLTIWSHNDSSAAMDPETGVLSIHVPLFPKKEGEMEETRVRKKAENGDEWHGSWYGYASNDVYL